MFQVVVMSAPSMADWSVYVFPELTPLVNATDALRLVGSATLEPPGALDALPMLSSSGVSAVKSSSTDSTANLTEPSGQRLRTSNW